MKLKGLFAAALIASAIAFSLPAYSNSYQSGFHRPLDTATNHSQASARSYAISNEEKVNVPLSGTDDQFQINYQELRKNIAKEEEQLHEDMERLTKMEFRACTCANGCKWGRACGGWD